MHQPRRIGTPYPPTHMVTGNSTASGIVNKSVKPKWSKAMDMFFLDLRLHLEMLVRCIFFTQIH